MLDPKALSATTLDVKVPIALDVTLHGAGIDPLGKKLYLIGFDAKGSVKRSDFGMGKYVPFVSDETGITISAACHKQPN